MKETLIVVVLIITAITTVAVLGTMLPFLDNNVSQHAFAQTNTTSAATDNMTVAESGNVTAPIAPQHLHNNRLVVLEVGEHQMKHSSNSNKGSNKDKPMKLDLHNNQKPEVELKINYQVHNKYQDPSRQQKEENHSVASKWELLALIQLVVGQLSVQT